MNCMNCLLTNLLLYTFPSFSLSNSIHPFYHQYVLIELYFSPLSAACSLGSKCRFLHLVEQKIDLLLHSQHVRCLAFLDLLV